jgi:hypothetical protein
MTLEETLAKLNWGGGGYAGYEGYGYMTGPETSAWNQLGYDASVMNSWMMNQFTEMQNFISQTLQPAITQMITNPQGFGTAGIHAMNTQLINNIGGQYSSQMQNLQQSFDTQNMAGLGSGVQQALRLNAAQTAAGQEATGLNQIQLQNAQLKAQQQLQGMQMGMQLPGVMGQLPQSAALAGQFAQLEGQEAKGFYGQQSPTSAILGSLADVALTVGGGLIGGPAGAMIGSKIGGAISGGMSGGGGGGGAGDYIGQNWGNWNMPSIWGGGQYSAPGVDPINPMQMGPGAS